MPSSKLGNIRNGDISREILVAIHSEGKEARKLETFGEFRGSLDKGNRILGGFTLAGTIRYNLIVLILAPIQFLIFWFEILEIYIYKD